MQIKSWQIASIGVLVFGTVVLLSGEILGFLNPLVLGLLVLILLYIEKTRKTGAIIGIIFGILNIINISQVVPIILPKFSVIDFNNPSIIIMLFQLLFGITSLSAGIHYFWKKV